MVNIYYKTFRQFLKSNYRKYLIFYEKRFEDEIIKVFSQYSKRFIIYDNFEYDPEDFKNSLVYSCQDDLEFSKIVDRIFNNKLIEKNYNSSIKQKNAIEFIVSEARDEYVKLYEMLYLLDTINPNYYVSDLHFFDVETLVLHFTNRFIKKEFKDSLEKPLALFIGNGIGDLAIMYSHLYKFIEFHKKKEIHIFAPTIKVSEIMKRVLPQNCTVHIIDNINILKKIYEYVMDTGKYIECYNLFFSEEKYTNEYIHYEQLFKRQLGISDDINPLEYIEKTQSAFLCDLSKEDKILIDKITSGNKVKIGLQFWTNEPEPRRCWSKDNLIEFCKKNSAYELFCLTPFPSEQFENIGFVDMSHLSISAMSYLISKMNIVVGIDSCCGHIAAAFNIPTITLWNEQTPIEMNDERIKISFRALRNNYSLVPKNGIIESIKADDVIEILNNIIDGKIKIKEDLITIDDSLNNYAVKYV